MITDGRFSGGSSGLSIGHVSPDAAAGSTFSLVRNGDEILIDVAERGLKLLVDADELTLRGEKLATSEHPWQPLDRDRPVSGTHRAYARLATSASYGAVRDRDR